MCSASRIWKTLSRVWRLKFSALLLKNMAAKDIHLLFSVVFSYKIMYGFFVSFMLANFGQKYGCQSWPIYFTFNFAVLGDGKTQFENIFT